MVLLLSHQQTKLWCFSIYIANDYNVKTIYYLHYLSPSQWMHQIHCCTMYSATNSIYWVVKKAASAMLDKNVNFISAKNSITASNTFTHLLNLREKEMSFLSVFFLSFRATARKLKYPILDECTKYEPKKAYWKYAKIDYFRCGRCCCFRIYIFDSGFGLFDLSHSIIYRNGID